MARPSDRATRDTDPVAISPDRRVCFVGDSFVAGVAPERSAANLRDLVAHAAARGSGLLVVGPPPVDDAAQNERIAALDAAFAAAGADAYVSVFDALRAGPVWMREVRLGDGAHPAAAGYERLAELVLPARREWLRTTTG